MNWNNNNYNEKEIKNKLKVFKEGKDCSVLREGKKKVFNFHNNFLRETFGNDYTTVYEVAENWDSDNFNYHREAAEYVNDKNRVTYRYEHRINKNGDYYSEWSWGNKDFDRDGYKHTWTLRDWSNPKRIEPAQDLKWKHNQLTDKLNSLLARPESDFGVNGKEKKECEIAEVKKDLAAVEREIRKEKNHSEVSCRQEKAFGNELHGCCNCGFKDIVPNDKYCQKCGAELCDKSKKSAHASLEKENQELRQQLTEVQKQLTEVLEELKKLKSNIINGKGSEKLNQQIVQNERLIKDSENVSVAEVKEQVQKSQALMSEINTSSSTKQDNKGNGSLPYVIGGSVILAVAGIISYLVVKIKKNKRK